MRSVSADVIAQLARYDSPTICNVIELFDYRPRTSGILSHEVRAMSPALPPMVGYVQTATFRSAAPPASGELSANLFEAGLAFDAVPAPRIFVIQDLDEPMFGAVNGEIVVRIARGFGCAGLVTNGFVRDVDPVEGMRFPCFGRGTAVSHGYGRFLSIGEPVQVGGVTLRSGDLLHGDVNGVTTIPLEIAAAVAANCQPFVDAEQVLMRAADNGDVASGRYEGALDDFRTRIDAISQSVRSAGVNHELMP